MNFEYRVFGDCFHITVYADGLQFEQLLAGLKKACPAVHYVILGKEVTSTGRPHVHCWLECWNKCFFDKQQFKVFTGKAPWVQYNATTRYKNLSYCTKGHDYNYLELNEDGKWKRTSNAYQLLAMAHANYCKLEPSYCRVLRDEEETLTALLACKEAERKGGRKGAKPRTDAESRNEAASGCGVTTITSERQREPQARVSRTAQRDHSPCRDFSKYHED